VGRNPASLVVGDTNGDGKPDIVATNKNDSTISVLLGDGAGLFSVQGTYATGLYSQVSTSGDIDGDGKLDVVVGGSYDVAVFFGGKYSTPMTYVGLYVPTAMAAADLNNDGVLDFVQVQSSSLEAVGVLWGTSLCAGP
jgi:hypothetical protein